MPRGGYKSVVHEDGSLLTPNEFAGLLVRDANPEDVVTSMYGMIWYLATTSIHGSGSGKLITTIEEMQEEALARVEEAYENFQEGLAQSPTRRFKEG